MNLKMLFICLGIVSMAQTASAAGLMQVSQDQPLMWYCKNTDGSYRQIGSAIAIEVEKDKLIIKELNPSDKTITLRLVTGNCTITPNYLAKPQ